MSTKFSNFTDSVTSTGTDELVGLRAGANIRTKISYIWTYFLTLTGNMAAVARVGVRKNSTGSVYERRRLNLIEGSGVTLTVADDSGNEEVDITIAASGGTTLDRCLVYRSGSQSISSATPTFATFNAEVYDSNSLHSTVTNTTRITIATTGAYAVAFWGQFASNSTGYRSSAIYKNGTDVLDTQAHPAASGTVSGVANSIHASLTAGDYLEVQVEQTSGGSLNLLGLTGTQPFFAVHQIA